MTRVTCLVGFLVVASALGVGSRAPSPQSPAAQRVAERLRALRQEASALQGREKTLLNELRKLELERQIRAAELSAIEQDLSATRGRLGAATARAAAQREAAEAQRPEIEQRLVRLYRMGHAGYWRLLLDVDDMQSIGRAYRTASALTRLDRDRVKHHEQTLAALDRERRELEARAREFSALQQKASASRTAVERAVASRAALMTSIAQRRDLTVQLATELDAAQQRLQTVAPQPGGTAAPVLVPIRPFRGQMPWPADGVVVGRFGRQSVGRVPGINVTRNGIDLSLPDGRAVGAVHEGVVTFAGPFTAFGNLVIVDHGGGAQTL